MNSCIVKHIYVRGPYYRPYILLLVFLVWEFEIGTCDLRTIARSARCRCKDIRSRVHAKEVNLLEGCVTCVRRIECELISSCELVCKRD